MICFLYTSRSTWVCSFHSTLLSPYLTTSFLSWDDFRPLNLRCRHLPYNSLFRLPHLSTHADSKSNSMRLAFDAELGVRSYEPLVFVFWLLRSWISFYLVLEILCSQRLHGRSLRQFHKFRRSSQVNPWWSCFLWVRCCCFLAGVVELENSLNPTENRKTIPALEIFI